jgi:hypothetical protein
MDHESLQMRFRAVAVAIAPVALLVGYGLRPYLSGPREPDVNAEALVTGANRWIWGHVIVALGLALTILSMLAIRSWLRAKGERFWSFTAVALVAGGATVLVFLVGFDGLGGWATLESGNSPEPFFASARTWERPLYAIGASILGGGLLALARAVVAAGALRAGRRALVIVGVLIAVLVAAVPAGWAVYAIGVGAGLASWPIALTMWGEATALDVTGE